MTRRSAYTLFVLILFTLIQYVYRKDIPSPVSTTTQTQYASVAETQKEKPYASVYVSRVVDGDTIEITDETSKKKVRLLGINAPESVDPRKKVECFGVEASQQLKKILEHRTVSIKTDDSQSTYDRYGRLLGYVYRDDGLFVNEYMIKEGYAYEYTYNTPYAYQSEFKRAQQNARIQEKGLWAEGVCTR